MGGSINFGGLISGIDSNALISSLVNFERQPIVRAQNRIGELEVLKSAIGDLRTQLLSLRNATQDFRFTDLFNQFGVTSSEETVLTATISGENPLVGAFALDVQQLASATTATSSATIGSAIDPDATLENSGIATSVEAGDFTINGQTFSVDEATDTLNGILGQINASGAGVTATYDAVSDRVVIENSTPGDTSIINFGASSDDTNFLSVVGLTQATQGATGTGGATLATSTSNLGAVSTTELLNTINFSGGAVTAGSFRINGATITVDPTVDTLSDVISRINGSDAGVSATYDANSDGIRFVSQTLGSPTIGFISDTSNFLSITNLDTATQVAGNDSQFTINGGPVLTRNSNEVSDAINGVTLTLLSAGESTATITVDDDAIVEDVGDFVEEFNTSFTAIRDLIGPDGTAENDGSIRLIENFLRGAIFDTVSGVSVDFQSLLDIGISSGENFEASAVFQIELDEDDFRQALRDDRQGVAQLFTNSSETGVIDKIFANIDEATKSSGFLNARVKSNGILDDQIEGQNNRIEQLERRVASFELRLRRQFSQLELLTASFQQQGAALSGIGGGFF
jgi:flagellar hook-associated protein 2